MATNNSPYEQPTIDYEGADLAEEHPVDAEDIAERNESDGKPVDWFLTHQIRAPEDRAPRACEDDGSDVENRAVSEVSMRSQHAVGATSTEPTAAAVVSLYRRIDVIIARARGQQYEDMRTFLFPARSYTLDHQGRGRDTTDGDGGGHRTDEALQAAIEAYPRALAAVEDAEAGAGGAQGFANPGSSDAQVKPAGGGSSVAEAAPIDVAGLVPQHPLSLHVQVSRERLGGPTAQAGKDGDGRLHDVDPPSVNDAIAESHDAAPAVPHRGDDAHAGRDVERARIMVPRAKIRVGESTQARMGINAEVVASYAEALRAGIHLPPPDLVRDDDNDCFWTADGHHRVLAHDKLHGDDQAYELEAMVQRGTHRDAVLLAVAANGDHGLQRTNADKRRAVTLLLEDPEWHEWSDREIARRCNVGHSLVAEVRRHLLGQAADAEPRRFVTRHGTESKMRLKGGQRAAGDAHHADPKPARLEPAAGEVATGDGESVPGSGDRTDASPYRASGDPAKTSLAAAASEPGGGRPAAAGGGQLGVVAGRHVRPSLVPTEVKSVVPTGVVASAGMDAMAAPEAPTLLDEMRRVHGMFGEAMTELQGFKNQITSLAVLTRTDVSPHYESALSMCHKIFTHLWHCEEILAGRTPGKRAARVRMGRPPAKNKPARSSSTPPAKSSAAKAAEPATAEPGKTAARSLAKTSAKSLEGREDKKNKTMGKTRR
jgi:hypothetical protein